MCEPYRLEMSERALERYQSIPDDLIAAVDEHLDLLAGRPVTLSLPSAFPHPPNRQLYHFRCRDLAGDLWGFNVFFKYHADEERLIVLSIGMGPYADPDE